MLNALLSYAVRIRFDYESAEGGMPERSELKLTKRVVDALEVESKDAVFWDRDLAGFGVRVHPMGRKVKLVQTRGPGGPKRVTLGRHGELSTDEARKCAVSVIDRIKRGEAPTPKPPEPALTVADLADRFMRVHVETHLKPGTRRILPVLAREAHPAGSGRNGDRTSRASAHAANHHEVTLVHQTFDFYMIEAKLENLIGGEVYDSNKLDEELRQRGIEMIAPHRTNRCGLRRSQRRWLVERFSSWN